MSNKTTVPEKTETDWAMDYANERARRIKAERRLGNMMLESAGTVVVLEKMIDGILGKKLNPSLLAEAVDFSHDLKCAHNLCLFDPPWDSSKARKRAIANCNSEESFPKKIKEEHEARLQHSALECREEWENLCKEYNLPSPEKSQSMARTKFATTLLKAMMSHGEIQNVPEPRLN